jgi:hypothetical protein
MANATGFNFYTSLAAFRAYVGPPEKGGSSAAQLVSAIKTK